MCVSFFTVCTHTSFAFVFRFPSFLICPPKECLAAVTADGSIVGMVDLICNKMVHFVEEGLIVTTLMKEMSSTSAFSVTVKQ